MNYQIRKPDELTENEIEHILKLWDISAWNTMKSSYFRSFFKNSEFHMLLQDNGEILALLRLNFDFTLEISGQKYDFAEVVGLVSSQKKKGYGKSLIQYFIKDISRRNIETIGFCLAELRSFYEKCGIDILYDKAKLIKEKSGAEWIIAEDDDILIFNISGERRLLLNQLDPDNTAYLIQ